MKKVSRSIKLPAKRIALRIAASMAAVALVLGPVALATAQTANGATVAGATVNNNCSFNGSQSPAFLTGVGPGSNISVSCSGLPAGATLAASTSSPLTGVFNPPLSSYSGTTALKAGIAEADGNSPYLVLSTASSSGTWSHTLQVPSPFAAGSTAFKVPGDPNAVCPPTQAQVNAGLLACAVGVLESSGSATNASSSNSGLAGTALLGYSNNPKPQPPTLTLSPSTQAAGSVVNISDTPGASSYWWGDALDSVPNSSTALILLVNGQPVTTNATVSPASYSFTLSALTGTLTPPKLSGHFTVPTTLKPGQSVTVSLYEQNAEGAGLGDTGNSTDPTYPGYITASATLTVGSVPVAFTPAGQVASSTTATTGKPWASWIWWTVAGLLMAIGAAFVFLSGILSERKSKAAKITP